MSKIAIKDQQYYIKDTESQAIVNNDVDNYKRRKAKKRKNLERENEINLLKNELVELKHILSQLIKK